MPMGRVLLEKLAVAQEVKNSVLFIEPEVSLPYTEQTVTAPCCEPDKSHLHSEILFL
jgi:hypothetical protein